MQTVHDVHDPVKWEGNLRYVAGKHGLKWTITLATLPTASEQEVFEQVARHLLTQGAVCHVGADCAYRGEAGACAAGALMSDNDAATLSRYNTGYGWARLTDEGRVPVQHREFVRELQRLHDSENPSQWRTSLGLIARARHLDASFIDREFPVSVPETTAA